MGRSGTKSQLIKKVKISLFVVKTTAEPFFLLSACRVIADSRKNGSAQTQEMVKNISAEILGSFMI